MLADVGIGQTPMLVDAMCRHRLLASRVRGGDYEPLTGAILNGNPFR